MSNRAPRLVAALALALGLAACTTTPTAPPPLELPPASLQSLDLDRWWTRYGDPVLDRLVDEALASNLDLRLALARIETARAQVLLAQSDLYPDVKLNVGASRNRQTEVGSNPLPPGFSAYSKDFRVGIDASYEVDLWNKYRTATLAARNDLLASRYAGEAVRTTIAADVVRGYFSLLAADAELALLRETLGLRDQTVALQKDRYEAGVIGDYDFAQAEAERSAVAADIAGAERATAQFEAALAVLVGRTPKEVYAPRFSRDVKAVWMLDVPAVPAGLPSDLLERRPDIRQSEAQLAAANQRIDVARADYFPQLTLTGALGTESGALRNLFNGPALIWGLGAALAQPLIGLKAIEANVDAKTAARDQVVVGYRQTVQSAFRDVHDALVANRSARTALEAQTVRRGRLEKALEMADIRYRAGYSPFLEVLDAQRQLLAARTLQIRAARDLRLAGVDLAKALGGGWDRAAFAAAVR